MDKNLRNELKRIVFDHRIKSILGIVLFTVLSSFLSCSSELQGSGALSWPEIKTVNKPGTYWWWMGSAVDKKNVAYNLENLNNAGIGGVHIIPIYGVKENEDNFINYITPKWMGMLDYTVNKADSLGMWVDISTGTGWSFSGSEVPLRNSVAEIKHQEFILMKDEKINKKLEQRNNFAVTAYSNDGKYLNLIEHVNNENKLIWRAPLGKWKIFYSYPDYTGQKVERVASGNEDYPGKIPCAQYHDSYEYEADWSNNIFNEFQKRRLYDLREYLPLLFNEGDTELVAQVKSDYRETLSDLHIDFIRKWNKWAHTKNEIIREQAHGAPANRLDLYASADIPETEIFGSTPFKISGFRRLLKNNEFDTPKPEVLRFAWAREFNSLFFI